jgi:hypothetical protein
LSTVSIFVTVAVAAAVENADLSLERGRVECAPAEWTLAD